VQLGEHASHVMFLASALVQLCNALLRGLAARASYVSCPLAWAAYSLPSNRLWILWIVSYTMAKGRGGGAIDKAFLADTWQRGRVCGRRNAGVKRDARRRVLGATVFCRSLEDVLSGRSEVLL
jgi:hypothetical protein